MLHLHGFINVHVHTTAPITEVLLDICISRIPRSSLEYLIPNTHVYIHMCIRTTATITNASLPEILCRFRKEDVGASLLLKYTLVFDMCIVHVFDMCLVHLYWNQMELPPRISRSVLIYVCDIHIRVFFMHEYEKNKLVPGATLPDLKMGLEIRVWHVYTCKINESSVNPHSTSNQSSKPCTVLQYPSRKDGSWYTSMSYTYVYSSYMNMHSTM